MAGRNADTHSHYPVSSEPLAPCWPGIFATQTRAEFAEREANLDRALSMTIIGQPRLGKLAFVIWLPVIYLSL